MNLETFLLMRNELMLLLVILMLVIGEIFISNKKALIPWAIVLFSIHTVISFFPVGSGSIFGGMFHSSPLIHLFKNVLNLGVLIILFQSADWLEKEILSQHKSTEFFMLLFSSLLGMYFMISSGDFLMFYLGLELSALPVAALVAFELVLADETDEAVRARPERSPLVAANVGGSGWAWPSAPRRPSDSPSCPTAGCCPRPWPTRPASFLPRPFRRAWGSVPQHLKRFLR